MGWLEDEGRLNGEEEAGGVEELADTVSDVWVGRVCGAYGMRGEEDELLG